MSDPFNGACEQHGNYAFTQWRGKYVDEGCPKCRHATLSKMLGLTEEDEDTIDEWFTGSRSVPPSWRSSR